MVRDNPKLLDDSGELPKLKEVVGSSIPDREIVSLLDKFSHVVKRLICPPPQKKEKRKKKKKIKNV